MFRKIKWIIIDVILVVATLLLGGYHVNQSIQSGLSYPFLHNEMEFGTYMLLALCFLRCYSRVINIIKNQKAKIVIIPFLSFAYTSLVFLHNNYLRFVGWDAWVYTKYGEHVEFVSFLKYDITYTVGWGEFRYPLVFIVITALFAAYFLYTRYKVQVKDKLSKLLSKLFCSEPFADDYNEQNTYIETLISENQRLREENEQMSKQIKEICELLEKEDGNGSGNEG